MESKSEQEFTNDFKNFVKTVPTFIGQLNTIMDKGREFLTHEQQKEIDKTKRDLSNSTTSLHELMSKLNQR